MITISFEIFCGYEKSLRILGGRQVAILVVLMEVDSNVTLLASVTYADRFEKQSTDIVNSFAIK